MDKYGATGYKCEGMDKEAEECPDLPACGKTQFRHKISRKKGHWQLNGCVDNIQFSMFLFLFQKPRFYLRSRCNYHIHYNSVHLYF